MPHSDTINYCLNDLTLINYANIGTPKQGRVISQIVDNWDNRRYLKPARKYFRAGYDKICLNRFPQWETRM